MSLTQGLHRAARRDPQKTALIGDDGRTNGAELVARVACLASVPRQQGVRRGDRVALLGPDSRRYAEADLHATCRTELAGYKCPKTLDLRESLPLAPAGKSMKNVLRAPFWQDHARNVH